MAKHKSRGKKHVVIPQGVPMDVANHPTNNLPDPSGGAFGGAINPAMLMTAGAQ